MRAEPITDAALALVRRRPTDAVLHDPFVVERLVGRVDVLQRIVKWACDTEDIDFYARDHPTDPQGAALLRDIVLNPHPKETS